MIGDHLWSDSLNKTVEVRSILACDNGVDLIYIKPIDEPAAEETIDYLHADPQWDKLHSIPITAEWLKDNGWDVYGYYATCPQVTIKTDGKIWMVTYYPDIRFNYVHELQHYMRLFKNPSEED